MSRNNNAPVTYCCFLPPIPTIKYYTCYKKEVCCSQGCCINGPYQIYQVWYYWLVILVLIGVISGGSWLCKKTQSGACAPITRNVSPSSRNGDCSHASCSRSRRYASCLNNEAGDCNSCENGTPSNSTTDFEENIILDRLFVSFRNRNAVGDPPSYTSILPSDGQNKSQANYCPLYSYYGPPPTYSSMYRTLSDISNENVPTTGVIQIQVHAEEIVSMPITDGNRETANAPNREVEIISDNSKNVAINVPNNSETVNEQEPHTGENVDGDTQLPRTSTDIM